MKDKNYNEQDWSLLQDAVNTLEMRSKQNPGEEIKQADCKIGIDEIF